MVGCETCDRSFRTWPAAFQHMNALDHWAERHQCESCYDDFATREECEEHMDDYDHWPPAYECEGCYDRFQTAQEAQRHMARFNHFRQYYCNDCDKGFQNDNNLQQLRGSAHRSNSIECPFCKKGHTTASGVAHHLETGSCPKARNLNRETIYKIINKRDTTGVLTNKKRTWPSQENATYHASSASFNGRQYECYLCHRGYGSLHSLNQHLSSPAHKQKIYHCISRSCGREFTALAQLFNHLESESCGAARFAAVQQQAAAVFTGRRMIAF